MQVISSEDDVARNNISGETQDFCGLPIGKPLAIHKEEDVHKIDRDLVHHKHAIVRRIRSLRNSRLFLPPDAISTLVSNDIDEDLKQPGSAVRARLIIAEAFPSPEIGGLNRA